jgi:hypothetical protein
MQKMTKSEAGYMFIPQLIWAPDAKGFQCAGCIYFIPTGECRIVEGTIRPHDCCNNFTTTVAYNDMRWLSGAESRERIDRILRQ